MVISDDIIQRAQGAYLGLAIGDALGATTEFMTPGEIKAQYGVHDKIIGGGWLRLKPGKVTDDTEMSLVLGDSILKNKGVKAKAVADSFSEWMRTKPVDIGHTVRRGLVRYRSTGNTEVPFNQYDAGNGACMRSLPVALYYYANEEDLLQASRIQSHVTHNNPVADAGTEAVLLMIVAAFHGQSKSQIKKVVERLIEQYPEYHFENNTLMNPSGWIIETLQVVFDAFFKQDDFESNLIDVVNRGGDADTTGAIAGMLAGAYYGFQKIPKIWINQLDQSILKQCMMQSEALIKHPGKA